MPEFLTISFLIAAAVAVFAGMVRGFAGFGAAMMMTPVFSALYGPAVGISLCMLLEIVVALPLLPRAVQYVDWRRIGLLMAAAVIGAPLGNLVLTEVSPEPMRWAISAIVLGAVALLASGWRFHGAWRAPVTLAIGATSGFLNGLSGMAGPPIAFYYLAGNETTTRVRANLTTYFIFVDLAALAVFLARDLVHWDTGVLALWLAPAVVAGGLLGERLFPLASEAFYRRLALGLLVGVAIGSLIL
ncbi:MAG: sulfite exporter TauE/SafE family protein [Alphaproteobacteria bacterium]|nr:MAG: sulfite exporter TauE/SafE family protein [Alphaproteobacteria bacterium]